MKVLYDHIVFEMQETGGVSKYFSEIISSLSGKIETILPVRYSNNHYIKNRGLADTKPIIDYRQEFIRGIEFKGKGRLFRIAKLLNRKKYPDPFSANLELTVSLLKQQDFDVFHPTLYQPYFLDFIGKRPFVVTIHDMIHEKYPEFIHKDDRTTVTKKLLMERAAHIICVSHNTKKDIVEIHGIPDDKITVIYHGIPEIKTANHRLIPENYILYVGERHGYKNFLFFLFSVSGLLREFNLKIVCAGTAFNELEKRKFSEYGIEQNVLNLHPSDEEIYNLYQHAVAFIFPSVYEGFGFPIIEAFACGCPVILSDNRCFREIAGDAALYFDPKSKNDIQGQIRKVIEVNFLREELISRGHKRKEIFSWSKAAEQTLDVYKRVI